MSILTLTEVDYQSDVMLDVNIYKGDSIAKTDEKTPISVIFLEIEPNRYEYSLLDDDREGATKTFCELIIDCGGKLSLQLDKEQAKQLVSYIKTAFDF